MSPPALVDQNFSRTSQETGCARQSQSLISAPIFRSLTLVRQPFVQGNANQWPFLDCISMLELSLNTSTPMRECQHADTRWTTGTASCMRQMRSSALQVPIFFALNRFGFRFDGRHNLAASVLISKSACVQRRVEELTFMWMRSCAICKALLKKLRVIDSERCGCGWEWRGA